LGKLLDAIVERSFADTRFTDIIENIVADLRRRHGKGLG